METKPSQDQSITITQGKRHFAERQKEIVKRLEAIADSTGETITPNRMDLYLQTLADLPYEPLIACLEAMVSTSRWFPKIPDIREAILGKPCEQKLLEDSEAEAAWIRCLKYANRWHPDLDPPPMRLTEAEQRSLTVAGGIYMLWTLQDDGGTELSFMRKAFFESFKRRDSVERVMLTAPQERSLKRGDFESMKQITEGRKSQ